MIYRKLCAGLCAGVLWCGVNAASAAIVIQTIPVPGQSLLSGITTNTTTPFDIVSFFDKFDLSLGLLTSVRFDFTYNFQLSLDLPAEGGGGSGSAGGPIFVQGDNPPGAGGGNGNGGGGPPSTTVVIPILVSGNFQVDTNLDPYLATLPGQQGIFDFNAAVNVAPSPGVTGAMLLQGTSSVQVTFTYTPVPEPAAAGLLSLGLFVLTRRRR